MDTYDLETINTVWKRVTFSEEEKKHETPPDLLQDLIGGEADTRRRLISLAARLGRGTKNGKALCEMAFQDKNHINRLQTAYFIRHGDVCREKTERPENTSALTLLRELYLKKSAAVSLYEEAMKTDPARAGVYALVLSEEKQHIKALEEMISRVFR